MLTYLRDHKRDLALLLLLSLIIIMPGISSLPLFDPDEPVYALTPQEMIVSGDWLSPQIYGQYWYDKPPLFYWLVAACFKIFGHNEFAARFPSALLGILTIFMLYYFVSEKINRRTGLLSAVVLLTSMEFFYLCKAAVIDITLLFCMTGALLCYWAGRYFWLYVFAGLAVVAKGPIGFLLPGAIIFLDILLNNRWRELLKMRLISGLIAFLVVSLPWYMAMWQVHGQAFIDGFLGANNYERFLSSEHPGGEKLWWFIPVLLIGMFPWTGVMLQAVYGTAKEALTKWHNKKPNNYVLFLHLWAWTIFAFFSISQTKLVTYILPMFPAIAIIIAVFLDKNLESLGRKSKIAVSLMSVVFAVLLSVAAVLGQAVLVSPIPAAADPDAAFIVNSVMAEFRNPLVLWRGILTAVVTLCVFGFANYKLWSKNILSGLKWQVGAVVLFTLMLVYVLVPAVYNRFDARELGPIFVNQVYDGKSAVYISKYTHPGFTFYTGINGIETKSQSGIENAIIGASNKLGSKTDRPYFVIFDSEYNKMKPEVKLLVNVEKQFGDKYILRLK